MQIWIDITDENDVAYGDGPITTATDWTQSTVLDKAGDFSFTMPASDPKAALLANRRYAHCYGVVDGAVAELGAGIIDRIEVIAGEPTMLRVSGPDLLAELGARVIPSLTVCEQELIDLTYNDDAGYWRGSARWISNRYGTTFDVDLPDAHDGITDTGGETITLWSEGDPNIEWLYVGCDARFDYVRITLSDQYLETNRAETTLVGQYFNGSEWVTLPDLVDGTSAEEMGHFATMRQTGNVTFTRPADWARVEPTAAAGSWFWVRFTVEAGTATDEFLLREVQVYADVPTTDGVNQIMAYAPDTWTKTGYDATTSAKYLEIRNESVLSALRMLVEQGGQDGGGDPIREHFTFTPARALSWIATFSASGVRAVQATGALPAGDGTCLIRSLREVTDTAETVTRLYPASNDGITLALTTRTAPATYTLSTAGGYLQNDTGNSLYGQIDAAPIFTDIQSQQSDSWYEHPMLVANALYDRALEYLRTHGTAQSFYEVEVVDAPATLAPGQTIGVVYQEYADAYHAVDIDATLYIMGTRTEVDDLGLRTVGLDVATIDRLPETDAGAIVGVIRDTRRVSTAANTTIIANVEGSVGGASFPGTIDFTTVNTDSGSEHFHYLDISTHTTNAAAHHAPVTVGNTGLSLSGQQLSLNLAATSGLEIASGLMLADSIAGDGLAITNKVLAVGAGDGIDVSANAIAVDVTDLIGSGLVEEATNNIALNTPGTLTVSSPNAAAGNHTHAVASSSNPGAAARILASDASGYLQLRRIGLGTAPSYPLHVSAATQQARLDYNTSNYLSITVGSDGSTSLTTATGASGGNLTLAPAGDVIFNPTGNDLLPSTGYDLNIGSLQKKYLTLHCAELWVETLVAQNTIATIGGRILVGPTTELTADLVAGSGLVTVKHNEMAYGDRCYMEADGKVEFLAVSHKGINTVNTSLRLFRISGNWTPYFTPGTKFTVVESTGNDGEYTVESSGYEEPNTFIVVEEAVPSSTADGGILYTGAQGTGPFLYLNIGRDFEESGTSHDWYAGDAIFNTGRTGDGFIDLYSVASVKGGSQYGPTIVGNVRTSSAYNAWAEHWAIGNLSGLYGYGSTAYGAAFGKYANDQSFLTVDATNGIRMLKRAAGTDTTLAQWAVNGVLTIGEVAAERSNIQISAGAFALRTNTTNLIAADTSGNLALGQVATDKGNAYWNASNSRLEFRGGTDGTTVNAYIDTDGAFVAADGKLAMYDDSFRVAIDNDAFVSNCYSFRWQSFTGAEVGFIGARSFDGSNNQISIAAKGVAAGAWGTIALRARLSTEDLQTDTDGCTFLVQPKNAFLYNQGLIVAADATNIAATVAAGYANIEGGLNVGTATGATAGQVKTSGNLVTAGWLLANGSAVLGSTQHVYLGDSGTDGTWRIGRSGTGLVFQRRESGSYVTKSTISA